MFVLFCLSCGDLPNQPPTKFLVLLESPPWVEVQQGGFMKFRPVQGWVFDFLNTNQVWAFGRKKLREPWGSGLFKKLKLTKEPHGSSCLKIEIWGFGCGWGFQIIWGNYLTWLFEKYFVEVPSNVSIKYLRDLLEWKHDILFETKLMKKYQV